MKHPCPVCGKSYFSSKHSFEICPICGWEDDAIQERDPNFEGGANHLSLNQAKLRYRKEQQDEENH